MPLLAQHLKHGQTCQLYHIPYITPATTGKHPNTVKTHSEKKTATNRLQICP